MREEFFIGNSLIQVEGDQLHVVECYDLGQAETEALCARLTKIRAEQGRLFLIFDGSRSPNVSPEGRRAWINFMQHTQIDAAVGYSVSMASRAQLTLVLRAAELRGGKKYPLIFTATAAEAFETVKSLRAKQA